MKYAVAVLNIKPVEFWDLTLAEFNIAMEAYQWKQYQERIINAEHALWTVMPHVKSDRLPSIEDMVGPAPGEKEEEEKQKVTTKDDLEAMKARMGK